MAKMRTESCPPCPPEMCSAQWGPGSVVSVSNDGRLVWGSNSNPCYALEGTLEWSDLGALTKLDGAVFL